MLFAKRTFFWAGIYGLVVLLPMYVLEARLGRDYPPPVTHPEYYYGFVGVGVAWQFLFLLVSRDPGRYRDLMLPAILGKLSYAGAVFVLFALGRVPPFVVAPAAIDAFLGGLFAFAYVKTRPAL